MAAPPEAVWRSEPAAGRLAAASGSSWAPGPGATAGRWEAERPCLGWRNYGLWEGPGVHPDGGCCLGWKRQMKTEVW